MKHKVFIIVDSLRISGPAKGLLQLIRCMPTDKVEFVLGLFDYPGRPQNDFLEAALQLNCEIVRLPERFTMDPLLISHVVRALRNHKCTIIQSHSYKPHLLGALTARRAKIPWIAVEHGFTYQNIRMRLYNAMTRVVMPFADEVITVSPKLQATLGRLRARAPHLILNAVDPNDVQPTKSYSDMCAQLGLPPKVLLAATIGRFSPEKGQDILLEALEQLRHYRGHLCVLLVGEGPEEEALQARAKELDLADLVKFVPYERKIGNILQLIDFLILPSRSEGLPNVVLEALCAGKAVIATNVGATGLIVRNEETGLLVPSHNAAALATGIERLIVDPLLRARLSAEGEALVTREFRPEHRVSKFLEMYDLLR